MCTEYYKYVLCKFVFIYICASILFLCVRPYITELLICVYINDYCTVYHIVLLYEFASMMLQLVRTVCSCNVVCVNTMVYLCTVVDNSMCICTTVWIYSMVLLLCRGGGRESY
jgi:hypothetical protein